MGSTYRDLLWVGVGDFVAKSETRGYLAYVVDAATCSCPAQTGTCWHRKEYPKAVFYKEQRERFRALGDDFAAFFNEWWPRYSDATEGHEYLGKSADDWKIFYAALLDEQNERRAYTRKYVSQVKDIFSAAEVE